MSVTDLEDREAEIRIRSAPSHQLAGRRLLNGRQSNKSPKRRLLSRSQARARSRGNYQRSFTPKQPNQGLVSTSIVRTPGYTLTRTPSKVKMDINTSAFFGEKESQEMEIKTRSNSIRESPTASSIMRGTMLEEATKAKQALQIQVAELNIRIEDIKQEYEEKQKQKGEEFQQLTEEMAKQHQTEISDLEDKHHQHMSQIQEYHSELVKTMNKEHKGEREQFEKRLLLADEKLQESLVEREKALQKLKEELEELHSNEINTLKEGMLEEAGKKLDDFREETQLQHKQEIEEITANHKQELDAMMAKLNEVMAVKEELQKTMKKNKKLEREISKQKEKIQVAKSQQNETESLLQETRRKLGEFEQNFQQKVLQVESSYKDRLDALMMENTQLRRRLLNKTDQFCEYRSNTERLQAEGIRSTKEKVQILLRARRKASLSIAMGTQDLDEPLNEGRPTSAPITRSERKQANLQTEIK